VHVGDGLGSRKTGSQPLPRGVYAPVGAPRGACRRLPPYYHHCRAARAPREPRGPMLSGERRELGILGNVRSAAATASRSYWSRLELPTPPLNNPGEGADRPTASNSPRRTPQVARSAVGPSCSRTTLCELGNPENVCGEKKRVPVRIWCLADCQKIRPTACPKCMRGGSCGGFGWFWRRSFRRFD